ncbi:MAG: nicotinate-nucleotide adenylyltransferase [bacterium]
MTPSVGIFGGTFDPIHVGHLIAAEQAQDLLHLDRVLFVPARVPPHKAAASASAEHRYRMTSLAVEGNPHFAVSDLELRREGPSYTVETLRSVRANAPADTRHYLLLGADSARDLEQWKDHEALLGDATVVVLERQGIGRADLPPSVGRRATFLSTPRLDISSSEIRRLVRVGGTVRYLVPAPVETYIRSEGLYRS